MRNVFAMLLALAPASVFAGTVAWPALPTTCFVSDRAATVDDGERGCAAFVLMVKDHPAGVPIKMDVPQYAMHVEPSGKETPVIIIQAEGNATVQAVGYKEVGTNVIGVALLREVRLLGTKTPPPTQP